MAAVYYSVIKMNQEMKVNVMEKTKNKYCPECSKNHQTYPIKCQNDSEILYQKMIISERNKLNKQFKEEQSRAYRMRQYIFNNNFKTAKLK